MNTTLLLFFFAYLFVGGIVSAIIIAAIDHDEGDGEMIMGLVLLWPVILFLILCLLIVAVPFFTTMLILAKIKGQEVRRVK